MTELEKKALAHIATEIDVEALLNMARNARNRSPTVQKAALRRLAEISAGHPHGTVEHDCWQMVHAVEALRRLSGRRVARRVNINSTDSIDVRVANKHFRRQGD